MSSNQIKPSKYIAVSGKTTIEECLMLMNKKNTSFVLIKEKDGEIEGIFTLKDLLKFFKYLRQTEYLSKPVRVVMSRPVHCLAFDKMDQAKDLMAKYGIRHLPIISDENHANEVVGVVDIHSLLKTQFDEALINRDIELRIAVVSHDRALLSILEKSFRTYKNVTVDKAQISQFDNDQERIDYANDYDILMCDLIDHKKFKEIEQLITTFLAQGKKTFAFVAGEETRTLALKTFLEELSKLQGLILFEKPVNIEDVLMACVSQGEQSKELSDEKGKSSEVESESEDSE